MAFLYTEALERLESTHRQNRLGHAYLLSGPEGCGKKQLVEGLCRLLVPGVKEDPWSHPDVAVTEPESKTRRIKVEQIRELEQKLQLSSSAGGRKISVVFDADRMMVQASNAFLKTLEEPPANSLLILLSTQPEALLDTILSRCIEVKLRREGRSPIRESERRLLDRLAGFTPGKRDLAIVFGMAQEFQAQLREIREQLKGESEAELKGEEAQYKKTTEGKWLEGREAHHAAMLEAGYQLERGRLVEVLMQWWTDIARAQAGGGQRDYPEYAEATAALAAKLTLNDTLRRIAAIEELREHFSRNLQEQLVIEVGFLKAFGGVGTA